MHERRKAGRHRGRGRLFCQKSCETSKGLVFNYGGDRPQVFGEELLCAPLSLSLSSTFDVVYTTTVAANLLKTEWCRIPSCARVYYLVLCLVFISWKVLLQDGKALFLLLHLGRSFLPKPFCSIFCHTALLLHHWKQSD